MHDETKENGKKSFTSNEITPEVLPSYFFSIHHVKLIDTISALFSHQSLHNCVYNRASTTYLYPSTYTHIHIYIHRNF